MPYLRCLRLDEADYMIREIYEGICENHSGKRSLAEKALGKGSTGRPCRKTRRTMFGNVTNARGSLISQDNPLNRSLLSLTFGHFQNKG